MSLIRVSCPTRTTRRATLALPVTLCKLLPGQRVQVAGDLALAFVAAMQIDQRRPGARVAHPVHQFTQACRSRGRQDVTSVAKVVNMNARHAESIGGRAPNALAEVAVPDWLSPGAREDQGNSRWIGELVQVPAKLCRDSCRKISDPLPGR